VRGVRALVQRRGDIVAASVAVLLVVYVVMLTLLDRQYPVNFTPLHAVFGLAVWVLGDAVLAHPWAARLREGIGERAQTVVALALAVPFAVASAGTARAFWELPAPFNLHAETGLLEHLSRVDPRDGRIHVVTTENLLAGIVESMSGGTIPVAQAEDYLVECRRARRQEGGTGDADPAVACYEARFGRLLETLPDRPLRFVLGADLRMLRDPTRAGAPSAMQRGLAAAAAARGGRVEAEASFETGTGLPAITLYRVD
jgi:hypothetical protein